jgi:hypothetical protein
MPNELLKNRRKLLSCRLILRLKLRDLTMHQNLFKQLRDGELLRELSPSLQRLLCHIRMDLLNVVLEWLKLGCLQY